MKVFIHLKIKFVSFIMFLSILFIALANAKHLEDMILLQGQYDNPSYTEIPSVKSINTNTCSFFSGNVSQKNSPNDGKHFLFQSSIGWLTPSAIGWVKPENKITADGIDNAAEYFVKQGYTYLNSLKTLFDHYYDTTSDDSTFDPDEIYMAYDFSSTDGKIIDPVTGKEKKEIIYEENDIKKTKQAFFNALKINPYLHINSNGDISQSNTSSDALIANLLLDISYYQSVSLIMQGNLCLEKAFSVRFYEFRNPNIDAIEDELQYLGWNSLENQFSHSKDGAWYNFNAASQVWLNVFASPIQRSYLLEYARDRKLGQENEWRPAVYDGYKDIATMMKALSQRAKVVYEVARRLVLMQKKDRANELIEEWVQEFALEEDIIMNIVFADNNGNLPDNHQELYPGLSESFLTFRESITKLIQIREISNSNHLNALGIDKNLVILIPGSTLGSNEFTYDFLFDKYLHEPGNPAGILRTSKKLDKEAKIAKENYKLKAADYLTQIDYICDHYDKELINITGDISGQPNLDNPENGGGLLEQQINNITLSMNAIERVMRQMDNVYMRIEIERKRVAAVNDELNKRADMIIQYGNTESKLVDEMAKIQGEMAYANSMTQALATSFQGIFTKNWIGSLGAGAIHSVNANIQRDLNRRLGKKQEQMVQLRTEKEAQFVYLDQNINDINSESSIKTWFLELRTLEIDLIDAQISYGMALNRLSQYYSDIESLVMRRDRAKQRVALKHFADPTFRIEILKSTFESENTFKKAQEEIYLTAKALEYKWPIHPSQSNFKRIFNNIFKARTADDLIEIMDTMDNTNLQSEEQAGAGRQTFYWNFSLRKDYLNMTEEIITHDGQSISSKKQFQNWLLELKNSPDNIVVYDDMKRKWVSIVLIDNKQTSEKYLSIPFSTVKFNINGKIYLESKEMRDSSGQLITIPNRPIFDERLWDDKIDLIHVNFVGYNMYSNEQSPTLMPVVLLYGGSSFVRTREVMKTSENQYIDFITYPSNWETHVLEDGSFARRSIEYRPQAMSAKLTTRPQDIPQDVIDTNNFRELPVAATNWRLIIPLESTNFENISDIEIVMLHKARTLPSGK